MSVSALSLVNGDRLDGREHSEQEQSKRKTNDVYRFPTGNHLMASRWYVIARHGIYGGMSHIADSQFLESLPVFTDFASIADMTRYRSLPDGWCLALADIVGSTGAIETGHYKSVNMAGAGVISAVLNALGHADLPFVFGGDGAVLAIPSEGAEPARQALAAVRRWADTELGLTMRAAVVPVSDIRSAGFDARVARFQASEQVSYAMFTGGGTSWADDQMKRGIYSIEPAPPGSLPDLTGLSCRWNPIPSAHGTIVSIIALPGSSGDSAAYRALVSDIIALTSEVDRAGHPVPADGPKPSLSLAALDAEAKATAPPGRRLSRKIAILTQYILTVSLDRLSLTLGRFDPKRYRRDVSRNSDFRKFDDGLKMTIDVNATQLERIEARLETASKAGICRYGLHRQASALMTCFVPSPLNRNHIHFIDGAAGGYAEASSRLKAKPV